MPGNGHHNHRPLNPNVVQDTVVHQNFFNPHSSQGNANPGQEQEQVPNNISLAVGHSSLWSFDMDSVAAAARHLSGGSQSSLYQLTIPNDNAHAVGLNQMIMLGQQLLDAALCDNIKAAPVIGGNYTRAYRAVQHARLQECHEMTAPKKGAKDATTRCMLAVNTAVMHHLIGIPGAVLRNLEAVHRSTKKRPPPLLTTSGLKVDVDSACSTRVRKMIEHVKACKVMAKDILTGTGVERP